MVSGSFSLLCSRFFSPFLHSTGSLSVSLTGWSPLIRPGFLVSWVTQVSIRLPWAFAYGAVTRYGYDFHRTLLAAVLPLSWILLPRRCRNNAGLGSSAFARHYLRNHVYFLFLRVLRCFSSPRWPTDYRYGPCGPGCPIRIFTGLGLFAPHRNFSQLITSFFASESLGILHAPFFTFFRVAAPLPTRLPFGVDMGLLRARVLSIFHHVKDLSWRITDSNR